MAQQYGLNGKLLSIVNGLIGFFNAQISKLKKAKEEISDLSKSTQVYDIFQDAGLNTREESISETRFNYGTGVVEMRMGDDYVFSVAHELKHAYQFEIGQINFTIGSYSTLYKSDEKEAYERGELFGGPHYDSLPSRYDSLPDGIKDSNHYGLRMMSPEILKIVILKMKFDFAERINNVTYYKQFNGAAQK